MTNWWKYSSPPQEQGWFLWNTRQSPSSNTDNGIDRSLNEEQERKINLVRRNISHYTFLDSNLDLKQKIQALDISVIFSRDKVLSDFEKAFDEYIQKIVSGAIKVELPTPSQQQSLPPAQQNTAWVWYSQTYWNRPQTQNPSIINTPSQSTSGNGEKSVEDIRRELEVYKLYVDFKGWTGVQSNAFSWHLDDLLRVLNTDTGLVLKIGDELNYITWIMKEFSISWNLSFENQTLSNYKEERDRIIRKAKDDLAESKKSMWANMKDFETSSTYLDRFFSKNNDFNAILYEIESYRENLGDLYNIWTKMEIHPVSSSEENNKIIRILNKTLTTDQEFYNFVSEKYNETNVLKLQGLILSELGLDPKGKEEFLSKMVEEFNNLKSQLHESESSYKRTIMINENGDSVVVYSYTVWWKEYFTDTPKERILGIVSMMSLYKGLAEKPEWRDEYMSVVFSDIWGIFYDIKTLDVFWEWWDFSLESPWGFALTSFAGAIYMAIWMRGNMNTNFSRFVKWTIMWSYRHSSRFEKYKNIVDNLKEGESLDDKMTESNLNPKYKALYEEFRTRENVLNNMMDWETDAWKKALIRTFKKKYLFIKSNDNFYYNFRLFNGMMSRPKVFSWSKANFRFWSTFDWALKQTWVSGWLKRLSENKRRIKSDIWDDRTDLEYFKDVQESTSSVKAKKIFEKLKWWVIPDDKVDNLITVARRSYGEVWKDSIKLKQYNDYLEVFKKQIEQILSDIKEGRIRSLSDWSESLDVAIKKKLISYLETSNDLENIKNWISELSKEVKVLLWVSAWDSPKVGLIDRVLSVTDKNVRDVMVKKIFNWIEIVGDSSIENMENTFVKMLEVVSNIEDKISDKSIRDKLFTDFSWKVWNDVSSINNFDARVASVSEALTEISRVTDDTIRTDLTKLLKDNLDGDIPSIRNKIDIFVSVQEELDKYYGHDSLLRKWWKLDWAYLGKLKLHLSKLEKIKDKESTSNKKPWFISYAEEERLKAKIGFLEWQWLNGSELDELRTTLSEFQANNPKVTDTPNNAPKGTESPEQPNPSAPDQPSTPERTPEILTEEQKTSKYLELYDRAIMEASLAGDQGLVSQIYLEKGEKIDRLEDGRMNISTIDLDRSEALLKSRFNMKEIRTFKYLESHFRVLDTLVQEWTLEVRDWVYHYKPWKSSKDISRTTKYLSKILRYIGTALKTGT